MIRWVKNMLGLEKPEGEQSAPAHVPVHFHIDRHPTTNVPDLQSMSKLEIDIWARNEIDVKLDRRRTKDYMIEQVKSHLNKEN